MTTSGFNLGASDDAPISEETPEAWGDLVDQFDDTSDEDATNDEETTTEESEETEAEIDSETPPTGDEAEQEIGAEKTKEEAEVEKPIGESEEDDTTSGEEAEEGLLEVPPPEESSEEETPPPTETDETDFDAQRAEFHGKLTEMYAVSEADLERFDENPGDVLPEFAANLHMKIMENVVSQVQQMLPDAISQISTSKETAQGYEDAFFTEWPELKGHDETITAVATQYRNMNPQASMEEAVKAVGINTLYKLGVSPEKVAARLALVPNETPPANEPEPNPEPHVPAGAGRISSRGEEAPPSPTLWDEMIAE